VTKSSGNWLAATSVRVDYLRDVPWDTEGGAYGGETAVQALIDTLLYDTSSFDGGRGMPAAPLMGSGMAVSEAGAASAVPRGLLPGLGGLSGLSSLSTSRLPIYAQSSPSRRIADVLRSGSSTRALGLHARF
jgi:hypothetical protein